LGSNVAESNYRACSNFSVSLYQVSSNLIQSTFDYTTTNVYDLSNLIQSTYESSLDYTTTNVYDLSNLIQSTYESSLDYTTTNIHDLSNIIRYNEIMVENDINLLNLQTSNLLNTLNDMQYVLNTMLFGVFSSCNASDYFAFLQNNLNSNLLLN
jgi:hypothetical protein